MSARALDHLVLGTRDLDALAGEFEALGFQVGARNRHPWGTENRLIQLADQTFLELITVGEGAVIPAPSPGLFSFGAFVAGALAEAPGMSMLVLKSENARADAAAFTREGMGGFAPFDFGRKGKRADGTEVEVAFTLAFAADPALPDCGFFTCQQHFPDNFWSPALQQHANGARGISRVTIVAENPSDHHVFLSAFAGSREMRAGSGGIAMTCGEGVVEIVSPETFRFLYGVEAPARFRPFFAGFGLRMGDPAAIAANAIRRGRAIEQGAAGFTLVPMADFTTAIVLEAA